MTAAEMEIQRDNLYADYLRAIGTPQEKEIVRKLGLMDEILGAMEGYEAAEETDTAAHWDEYMLDLKIDLAMDEALLAYEI